MHWENKSPSSCIYTISCLSWQKKKSDWHISAAKDDRHHSRPIQYQGPYEALGRWQSNKSHGPFPTIRDNQRWRRFGGGVQREVGKRQEGVRARIIVWEKRRREKCVFYCFMRWVGGCECTCASTLCWKAKELLTLASYNKSQNQLPASSPLHRANQHCSAGSVQAGAPTFLCCLGASLWCAFEASGKPCFPLFQSLFSQGSPGPVLRTRQSCRPIGPISHRSKRRNLRGMKKMLLTIGCNCAPVHLWACKPEEK